MARHSGVGRYAESGCPFGFNDKSIVDYGLYASGANGALTLTTSRGDFDDSDALAPKISIGVGTIRASVKELNWRIRYSDLYSRRSSCCRYSSYE